MATVNKKEIMDNCLKMIKSKYPASVIGKYSDIGSDVDIKTITTGSISADYVLGKGFARISEIVGYPSTGKTTLAFTTIAKLQERDPDANILYVDAEYAVDPSYAAALGVNMEKVYLLQPESSVTAYDIVETMIKTGVLDLVIIDSIAALVPPEYTDKEIGDAVQIASFARLTTQAVVRINRLSNQYDTHVIFINQYKDAVSPSGFSGGSGTVMGNTNKYAPGGPSKDFYFQQILETKRVRQIKKKDGEIVSNVYEIKSLKNKVAPPYRKGEIVITFGKGLDLVRELMGLSITYGFIKQGGAYYTLLEDPEAGTPLFEDLKPINGEAKVVEYLTDNPEAFEKLRTLVKEKIDALTDNGKNKIQIGMTEEEVEYRKELEEMTKKRD